MPAESARRRAPRLSVVAVVIATLLAGAAVGGAERDLALAQDADRPIDASNYFDGIAALRDGDRAGAAKLLRRVVTKFPDSPYAPPAALKLAEMIYPVTSWDQIGSASAEAIDKANRILSVLAKKYKSSREAAPALIRLGYLGMEPANPKSDLDRACARFSTAVRLYPDSDAADQAFFGFGRCETLRERPVHAAAIFAQLLDEHPGSRLAAETNYRFGLALSHLDDPGEAVLALQEVRNRYPESPFAGQALERITLIHRLRLPGHAAAVRTTGSSAPGAVAGPPYRFDAGYGVAADAASGGPPFRGISDIGIDPQGLAVVASPKTPGIFRLDRRGHIQERIEHPGPEFVSPAVGLSVYISGRDQIAINTRNWSGSGLQGTTGRSLRDYGPIAVDAAGRVHLLDRRDRLIYIFDRNRRLVGSIEPDAARAGRFVDLATGGDGGVYALDGRAGEVVEIRQGRVSHRIDITPLEIQSPVALAVDGLGDLFVLDGKRNRVAIADPEGRRIGELRPPREIVSRLGRFTAIAVDPQGRIYLSGSKDGQIVRFR